MAPGLLAAALSGHVNNDLKPATSFASDYPFPCLLNPETDVEPEVAALAPGTPENEAEEPAGKQNEISQSLKQYGGMNILFWPLRAYVSGAAPTQQQH